MSSTLVEKAGIDAPVGASRVTKYNRKNNDNEKGKANVP